jgi:hypothetical protein
VDEQVAFLFLDRSENYMPHYMLSPMWNGISAYSIESGFRYASPMWAESEPGLQRREEKA